MKLASNTVCDVNEMRGESNLTYARKAIISCEFAKQTNGLWGVRQLPRLQNIVSLYRENSVGLNFGSI